MNPIATDSHQTYFGLIMCLQDALLILEGIRLNVLRKVQRRLTDVERKCIVAGAIYAWNETELTMKRWTDGKSWLASKVKGPFLIYNELDSHRNVKSGGLVKQSFSLTTKQGEKFHMIAYYNPEDRSQGVLPGTIPSQDSTLLKLHLDPSVYLSDFLHYGETSTAQGYYHGVPESQAPHPRLRPQSYSYPSSSASSMHNPSVTSVSSAGAGAAPSVMYNYPQSYYCHPLLMPYQYNTVPQSYQYAPQPQQQVYMQLMPAPAHSYGYIADQDHRGSTASLINGLPTPALSASSTRFSFSAAPESAQCGGLSPGTLHRRSDALPTLSQTHLHNAPHSPQSIPSPSLQRAGLGYVIDPMAAGSVYGTAVMCGTHNYDRPKLGKPFYV
ncbi:hypothetical protein PUMCH_002807 [Australozyma saopauloensis]|uniref:Gti1/Pac2 family-domain-containing protein n=1 Tax=Australozyma saopauloensis TaxID=291208 RepID=A0AAX4HAB1_9ASCO|nr:hypothetical protein PUMCH_002807 [[Candida] saopauloensis]